MKITIELLKRYHLNRCDANEREAVENWLLSSDIDSIPEPEDADELLSSLWTTIETRMELPKKNSAPAVITFPRKPFYTFVAAASLLLGIFVTGYFSLVSNYNLFTSSEPSGKLVVVSGTGERINIDSDSCRINFTGYLQLINTSSRIKTIFCGTPSKVFVLNPGETYYLERLNGVPHLMSEQEAPVEEFSRNVRG